MNISFAHSDLDKWADFSNDYNPIHFDENVARTFGHDGVLVHGMLAIMAIMNEVPRLVEVSLDNWFEWKCTIKKPLPVNSTFTLDIASAKSAARWNYHLMDLDNSSKSIRGNFGFCEEPQPEYMPKALKNVHDLADKLNEFWLAYPHMGRLWMALNAILFSDYLGHNPGHVLEKEIKHWLKNVGANQSRDNLIMMHTNHKVQVAPSLFVRTTHDKPSSVQYSINVRDLLENTDSLYGLLEFGLWVDSRLEMVMEMGLIVIRNSEN